MNELTKTAATSPSPSAPTTVLVTGSSRGIGRAIALRLAQAGHDIVVHCRSGMDLAQQAVAEIHALGRSARVLQFDVADRSASAAALETAWDGRHPRETMVVLVTRYAYAAISPERCRGTLGSEVTQSNQHTPESRNPEYIA